MLGYVRRSAVLRRLTAALGAGYIRLIEATTRWEIRGVRPRALIQDGKGRWIVPCWHGRLLVIPGEKTPPLNVWAMISANRDGEIIADCVGRFGVPSIRGSSQDPRKPEKNKGGAAVASEATDLLTGAEDVTLVITPDGPRGPRMRCQPGVAALSMMTRVPVIPFAYATSRGRVLGSWDSFFLPYPFGRGVKVWGEPLYPPEDRSPEAQDAYRLEIEAALNAATRLADETVGRVPVEPAAPRRRPTRAAAPAPDQEPDQDPGAGTT